MRIVVLILAILMVNEIKLKVEGAFPDAVPSHLICYSKNNLENQIITVASNVMSLANYSGYAQDFNDTIGSCSVTGIWILYHLPGFQGKFNAVYGEDSSFIPSLSGNISSIRKVESNHKFSNELVLFEEPLFQKIQACNVLGGKEFPDFCHTPRSAIVKGFSDWTILSDVDNGGNVLSITVCLKANRNGAAFFATLDSKTVGYVTSIKQGCEGRTIDGEAQITDEDQLETPQDCGCFLNGVLNGDTTCNKDGECNCNFDQNFEGPKCDKCSYGYYMKNDVCEDCQCNQVASDGCDIHGDCTCTDPSFTGKKCTTKNIELKITRPKSLRVICTGQCETVTLHIKKKDNKSGSLTVSSRSGSFSCNARFTKEKQCTGTVKATSFRILLGKYGSSPRTISIAITATKLSNVR